MGSGATKEKRETEKKKIEEQYPSGRISQVENSEAIAMDKIRNGKEEWSVYHVVHLPRMPVGRGGYQRDGVTGGEWRVAVESVRELVQRHRSRRGRCAHRPALAERRGRDSEREVQTVPELMWV